MRARPKSLSILLSLVLGIAGPVALATPNATDDSYSVNANGFLTVDAASGLLANDTGFNAATHRLEFFDAVSQYGARVQVSADGAFTYDPPAGFRGLDTFGYTVRSTTGARSAIVSIEVSGDVVWFVDASAAPGGDGTFGSPFNSLAPVNGGAGSGDVDATGDTIFLYSGTYSGVEFDLEPGQRLIGQAMGLDLVGTQNDIAPGPAPVLANTGSFPVVEIFGQGGQIRGLNLQTSAGWAIKTAGANGGFTIADVNITVSGTANGGIELISSIGTIGLTNVNINGASDSSGAALRLIGTLATITLTNVDVGAGSGFTGGQVLNADGNAGTISFDSTSTLRSTNTAGLEIRTHTATSTITLPEVNIAGGANGQPLVDLLNNNALANIRFDQGIVANTTATDSIAFSAVGGGRLRIGGTSNILSATDGGVLELDGMELTANAVFASLSSTSSAGAGIRVVAPVGSFDVQVTGTTSIVSPTAQAILIDDSASPSGFSLNLNTLIASGATGGIRVTQAAIGVANAASSLTTTTGIAVFCQNGATDLAFATLSSAGAAHGLSFDGCAGTVSAVGGTLTSTSGVNNHVVNLVNTSGSNAINLSYGGSITKNNSGRAVNILGLTGAGSATFNGTVTGTNASSGISITDTTRPVNFTTLNLGTSGARFVSTPITLAGNTGAVSLGNVGIFTNAATALNINYTNASPGQVNSSGSSVLDVTGAALALNVSHSTQQPLGLQFASIASTGGGTHAINVQRASGSLTVSGLVNIGAKTAAGVEIRDTNNFAVSLGEVDITNATGDGVRLTNNAGTSSFTILGDGNFSTVHTDGAGGLWQNIGGSAFSIEGSRDIRVTDLTITGVGNHGVVGRGIVNLLFSNVDMSNIGNADNEHVFNLREGDTSGAPITGSFEVNHSVIENFTDNGVYLENFAGTLDFRWTNNVLRNNITTTACGGGNCNGNGILLRADGTARINAFILNSAFERIDGIGLTANPEGNSGARMDINVAQSAFTAEPFAGFSNTNNGETAISLRNAQGNSTLNFRLFSNDIRNYSGELALGVVEIEGGDFTTTNGVIDTLFIYHAHEGNALQIFSDGANTSGSGTTNFTMNVSINGLNVPAPTPILGASLLLNNNGAISGSTVQGNYIVRNSNLLANATGASRRTLTMNVRDFNNACADIRGNVIAAGTGGTQPSINLSYNGSGAVRLQGMVGSGDANAQSYLNSNNTLSVAANSGPNNNITSATCTTPTLPVAFPFN